MNKNMAPALACALWLSCCSQKKDEPAAAVGPKAYVGLFGDNAVAVVDLAANRVTKTMAVPAGPHGVVITPGGEKVYVSSDGATTVSVISTADDSVTTSIEVGMTPHGLSMSADGKTVVVSDFGTDQAVIIDTATDQVAATVAVNRPHNSAISPDAKLAFEGSQQMGMPAIVVVDLDAAKVVTSVALQQQPRALDYAPNGKVYFTVSGKDELEVLDPKTNELGAHRDRRLAPSHARHQRRPARARRQPNRRRSRIRRSQDWHGRRERRDWDYAALDRAQLGRQARVRHGRRLQRAHRGRHCDEKRRHEDRCRQRPSKNRGSADAMSFSSHAARCGAMLLLLACSDPGAGEPARAGAGGGGSAGAVAVDAPLPPGNLVNGMALADKNSCTLCHYSDYGGVGFNPNITPDAQFGLGKWTDGQVAAAIRSGLSSDGTSLCPLMARFAFSDQEVSDVITFLRRLPGVARANATLCPGHAAKAM
jgi:YVTN family beta-propeller protein